MINLRKLLTTQKEFADTILYKPEIDKYLFAMNIEVGEFLNLLPWKWWKKKQVIDKARILDELADIMAFWLSWYMTFFENYTHSLRVPEDQLKQDAENMIDMLEYHLNTAKKPNKEPKLYDFNYPAVFSMTNLTYGGSFLARLISITMFYTDCSILDVVEAYHKKMEVNHLRQKTNY